MKKFHFPLNSVLNIREKMIASLQIEYANILQKLQYQKEVIQQQNFILREKNEEFKEKNLQGMPILEVSMYKNFFKSQHIKIEAETKKLLQIEEALEVKRIEILEMNKEISSIQNLKDKRFDEYLATVKKSEELFIEEFVGLNRP